VRNIYLGPPGTGKTSKLLELVDSALEIGTPSRYIGYFAFTRAANEESINRACTKFQLSRKDLPFFRTLHSLAFRQLGLKSNQVMGDQHYQEFGEWLGLRISGGLDRDTGVFYGNERGDEILALINKARIRDISVEHQWYDDSSDISWLEVERVDRALRLYKERREIVDYTDMLSLFLIQKPVPFLETIFIDEAQDLNRLQWKMVYLLEEVSKNCVIAGDDDQAIFKWAGADVDQFLDLTGRTTVLDKSFRLPNKIANFAKSIVKRIDRRYEKEWSSRDDEGLLEYHTKFDYINMSKGEWLVLARTHYLLQPIEAQCRREGWFYSKNNVPSVRKSLITSIQDWEKLRKGESISSAAVRKMYQFFKSDGNVTKKGRGLKNVTEYETFSLQNLQNDYGLRTSGIWHEAFDNLSIYEREYMIALLRRGEKLTEEPRVRLSTIHAAKGKECQHVVLLTDLSRKAWTQMQVHENDELRTFYVGATRARESLHVIMPQTQYFFPIGANG
tara:strand:+ start:9297 stop:10805 length:1509 start_codon:yes stop_codon:yes gene_type:complete